MLDISALLGDLSMRFEEAGKGFDVEPLTLQHNDVFSRVARKLRRVRGWVDEKLGVGEVQREMTTDGGQNNENKEVEVAGEAGEVMNGMSATDFDSCLLDEGFWTEMMNDWEG